MIRVFGPKRNNHPSIGETCSQCGVPFVAGDYTSLVELEPADEEETAKKAQGRPYNAVAVEVHSEHPPRRAF